MKKLIVNSIYLILFLTVLITFSHCKKDKDINVVITVRLLTDSTKTVSNALVKIYVDPTKLLPSPNPIMPAMQGYTDGAGQFRTTYKLEAILNVSAQKDNMSGQTIITLKEGKTVEKTVLIH